MKKRRIFLKGKTIFIVTCISVFSTLLIVYFTGISLHRTIVENSYISLSILALVFFSFLTIGLYKGLHIHDDLSHKLNSSWKKPRPIFSNGSFVPDSAPTVETDDMVSGIVLSILIWIGMALMGILLMFIFDYILWVGIVFLIAMIYWVLIRALKLIFTKSKECEKDLLVSMKYGFTYTILYLGWIYGVVYISTLL